MVTLLLLLAAAHPSPHPASTPTPGERAEPRAKFAHEAEGSRAAIEAAVDSRLLGGGYFQLVTGRAERAAAAARFQERLRSIGIPASVGDCEWIGLVAAGVAKGNRSYGGACRVKMGSKRPDHFLICDADLGGITLTQPAWFASDPLYIELFIRRTCL